ncbi:MAG: hypothetical protein H7Y86_05315, partial [Rhizobacter sp.]|nr:hypothetical protein [Ferruginibacter sp.]
CDIEHSGVVPCHCGVTCTDWQDGCPQCSAFVCTNPPSPGGSGTGTGTSWPPDPGPGAFPPPPGPSSGGGGSNPPPGSGNCSGTNNCGQLRSLIIEGRVPCGGCGSGPIIVIPPDEPPISIPLDSCAIAHALAKRMDTLYMKGKVDSMLSTIPGWQGLDFEKGFPIYKYYTNGSGGTTTINSYAPGAIQGSSTSMNVDITFTIPPGARAAGGDAYSH